MKRIPLFLILKVSLNDTISQKIPTSLANVQDSRDPISYCKQKAKNKMQNEEEH